MRRAFPTPETDRLLYNLDHGLPSLCAYVFSHPNMVEVAGVAGMDAFMADMMFTAHDWDNIAHLIRAARGTGISPLIRVQAFPWATGTDRRTVSDAARALALGATAVTVSVGSKEEVQELMGLRDDWHRLIHLRRFNTAEEFPEFNAKTREGTLVVPTVESEGGLSATWTRFLPSTASAWCGWRRETSPRYWGCRSSTTTPR